MRTSYFPNGFTRANKVRTPVPRLFRLSTVLLECPRPALWLLPQRIGTTRLMQDHLINVDDLPIAFIYEDMTFYGANNSTLPQSWPN